MKLLVLFLLGFLVSCQPMAVRQSTIPGASSGDQENSLGDELFNNTWYRDIAPGVITSNVFHPDGRLTVKGYRDDLTTREPGYDHDWNYRLNGSNFITIDHDFYAEQYSYTINDGSMRMCDTSGQCTDFFIMIEM